MATNGNFMPQEQYNAGQAAINSAGNGNGAASQDAPQDAEVGWLFVESYYTTLSKTPEKLHVCMIMLL